MTTSRTHKVMIDGPGYIELGELKWLISQLDAAPDSTRVKVAYLSGGGRETDSCSLSANVPDRNIQINITNPSPIGHAHIPGARGGSIGRPIKDQPQA